ncbi:MULTISPECIES: hypothetical protein [Agrobacterium]|uniref:hypothetical protein n=2 Tax=Rhizobium/Agrobacterium group TaxID=227290 RepID=UPI0009CE8DEA|nr:conserved membrane hypothetical protein [Agrobacterium genomosp. 5 str. CFBP 6626]
MTAEPCSCESAVEESHQKPRGRILRFTARLPFAIFRVIVWALLYSAWYMLFFILCMLRPFIGMAVAAAVVMVPLSIAAFVKPEVANGMPFWAFILMTLGFVGFAIGYTIFLGWITPPGAADPFARYRRSSR